jgi:hypothetical protein
MKMRARLTKILRQTARQLCPPGTPVVAYDETSKTVFRDGQSVLTTQRRLAAACVRQRYRVLKRLVKAKGIE